VKNSEEKLTIVILYRFDQRLLAAFVAKFFCQESLNSSYPLIKDDLSSLMIPMPQETTKTKYVDWMKHLPSDERPTWLGLPDNAEKVLLISEGIHEVSMIRSH
jgi:dynein heavy chain 1